MTMTIDALYPISGDHAIQSAAFVLQWGAPLSRENLQGVRSLAERFKAHFPVVQEHKAVTVEFALSSADQPAQLPRQQVDDLAGIHFVKPNPALGPAGVTRTLQVNKENLIVVINDYTRWVEVWRNVSTWLEALGEGVSVSTRAISG